MKWIKLFEDYNEKFITLYHGTKPKFVNTIKKNGLVSNLGYGQGWYMLATDFESALYHAYSDENEKVYVIEFKVPIIKSIYWDGFPYLWSGEVINDTSTWYALREKLPAKFISNIIEVDREDWLKQKNDKF